MDLEQLNAININDKEQVKGLQQFLKTRGYYNGPIDGKWGGGTTEGAVKLRGDLQNAANTNLEISRNQVTASDPTRNAIRGATEFGPYAVGAGVGAVGGHYMAKGMTAEAARQRAETARIAADKDIAGSVGVKKIRQMERARRLRTGGQFLAPAALLGSAELIREHVAPKFDDPETKKWINLGANADQGAGLGLLVHQLADMRRRFGSPADQADEALIETRAQAPRNALDAAKPPASPEEAPAAPKTPNSARLIAAARAAGATGPLTKQGAADFLAANPGKATGAVAKALGVSNGPNLSSRIANAVKTMASTRGASSIALPLLAGGLAYELAGEPAEAADGSGAVATPANRLAAAGTAAGTAYGVNKLAQALPQAVNTAFSAVGRMQPVMMVDELTNWAPMSEEGKAQMQGNENQTLNMLARNLPHALQPGAVRHAGEMAQVPPRNPMFHDVPDQPNALAAAGDQPDAFGAALADFMSLLRDGGFGEQEVMR